MRREEIRGALLTLALITLASSVACGDSRIEANGSMDPERPGLEADHEGEGGTSGDGIKRGSELIEASAIRSAGNGAQFVIDAGEVLGPGALAAGMIVEFEAQGEVQIGYATVDREGRQSAWSDEELSMKTLAPGPGGEGPFDGDELAFDDLEGLGASASIAFERPAWQILVRVSRGSQSVDSLRVRLLDRVYEGVAAVHYDEPGDETFDGATFMRARAQGDYAAIRQLLAGPWSPDPSIFRGVPRIPLNGSPSRCANSETLGSQKLKAHLKEKFSGIDSIGGFVCRKIRGGRNLSVHASGRALDVMIAPRGREANNAVGDPIVAYLIKNSEQFGVQRIIWDQMIWNTGNSAPSRYRGAHNHKDHIHLEINERAGAGDAPFYRGAQVTDVSAKGRLDLAPAAPKPAAPASDSCLSRTMRQRVGVGTMIQMPYATKQCGSPCAWAECAPGGGWSCAAPTTTQSDAYPAPQCGGIGGGPPTSTGPLTRPAADPISDPNPGHSGPNGARIERLFSPKLQVDARKGEGFRTLRTHAPGRGGETVYLPALEGFEVPRLGDEEPFTHDGCFTLEDARVLGTEDRFELLVPDEAAAAALAEVKTKLKRDSANELYVGNTRPCAARR